jgi:hypothetical protein
MEHLPGALGRFVEDDKAHERSSVLTYIIFILFQVCYTCPLSHEEV